MATGSVNMNGNDYSDMLVHGKKRYDAIFDLTSGKLMGVSEREVMSMDELNKLFNDSTLIQPTLTAREKREILLKWEIEPGSIFGKGGGSDADIHYYADWETERLVSDAEKDYREDYEVDMSVYLTPSVAISDTNYDKLDEVYINAATHEIISKEEYKAIEDREDSAEHVGAEADVNDSYYYLYGLNSQFIDSDLVPAFEKYLVNKLSNSMINTDDEFSIVKAETGCMNEFIAAAKDVFLIRPEHEQYISEKFSKVMYDVKVDLQHGGERFGGHT